MSPDWLGFGLGLAGAMLVALGHRVGFWLFLASNVAWIVYAYHTGQLALLWQQTAFSLTSIIGISRSKQ